MSRPVYLDPNLHHGAERIGLTGAENKHALVKRTEIGEHIDIVDGRGLRATVAVETASGQVAGPVIAWSTDPQPPVRLTLVQALAKGGRDEAAVEAAVEVGYSSIIPWQADRSIVKWMGVKAEKNRDKWANIGIAAMKQSRQSWIPTVSPVHTTKQLAQAAKEAGARLIICHETATQRLSELSFPPGDVWVLVGPEGGITDHELEILEGEKVLLGPTILRSGTAGPIAGAIINVLSSNW